jgi:hypothetical protein
VGKLLDGIERIRALVESDHKPLSEETVQKIQAVCTELVPFVVATT